MIAVRLWVANPDGTYKVGNIEELDEREVEKLNNSRGFKEAGIFYKRV